MVEWFKDFLVKIATPFAFVAGILYFLFTRRVPDNSGKEKFLVDQAVTKTKEEEIDAKATSSATNYEQLRAEYLRDHGGEP